MVYYKNYFNLAKIFVLMLFRIVAICLNRGLSSNFWWQRSANHVESIEE